MKLTTKARYALRAMVDLAVHCDQDPVPRKDIARRQEISPHYIEQLFLKLRDAGYIEAVRGPRGGYLLSEKPEDIKVGALVEVVEGFLAPVPCLVGDPAVECHRAPTCVTRRLWRQLGDTVYDFLNSVTLQDLSDQARGLLDESD
jgi:Rrf2 family cysteine metabolism transcriptional repressor